MHCAEAVSAGAEIGRGGSEVAADFAENKSCLSSLVPTAECWPVVSSSGPG